jgi:hypothetical protein
LKEDGFLVGLWSLRLAKKTFFVSTTVTDFLINFGDVLPNTKPETFVIQLLSKAEIYTSTVKSNLLDKYCFKNAAVILVTAFATIAKKAMERMVIVFTEQEED